MIELSATIRLLLDARDIEGQAETALKAAKDNVERLEAVVVEGMVAAGVQNMTINGRVVYLSTRLFCNRKSGVTPDDAVALMHALELDDLIETSVQPARLKSFVREGLEAARESVPDAHANDVIDRRLLAAFDVVEVPTVNVRKAASK
jgi:hypothetical protein